jgi:hypothetical protein
MAYQPETTYASQILTIESRITAIKQQIEAEHDSIAAVKRPCSLLQAFVSAPVRQAILQEVYRSRGRIALLERDLVQAEYEKKELERLRTAFPEHDRLIERAEQLHYRSWHTSLQEDEFEIEDRELQIAERLEEKRVAEEEKRIQQEADDLAKQQRELARKQEELTRRQSSLRKKKAPRDPSTSSH